jgi:hypothetical protein
MGQFLEVAMLIASFVIVWFVGYVLIDFYSTAS